MKTIFDFQGPSPPAAPLPRSPEPGAGELTLPDLRTGESGVVTSVEDTTPRAHRLLDLGLVPGTPVRALRRAPLGDPTVYELRGYQLCLRRTDAACVRVRLDPDGTAPGRRGARVSP
jgi:ferrous iron transport protein A